MSDDNTHGGAEPPPASAGSRPVAWAIYHRDGTILKLTPASDEAADALRLEQIIDEWSDVDDVRAVPLYRSQTVNATERMVIESVIGMVGPGGIETTLRGLLKRLP